MTNIVPVRPAAPTPLAEIEKLAEAVAKSGMFGIRTREQALVLMAISQAEGRHPALAARDYHIIEGKPAKTAEAMQRDFLSAGGRIEWHQLDDNAADATFSHPSGGSLRIIWDQARVKQAGLAGRAMHQKYPRQMLRSRCVSEGIKSIYPAATSGMYVPEEVAEFTPREPPPEPESVAAELDSFAASVAPADAVSPLVVDAVRLSAEEAATKGTAAFRTHWRKLGTTERELLAPDLAEYRRVANEADEAAEEETQREADPFGLLPVEPPPFLDAPELPRSSLWDDPDYTVTLRDGEAGPQWKEWSDRVGYLASEARTLDELDKLIRDNDAMMSRARRESGDDWRHIRDAVDARRAALT